MSLFGRWKRGKGTAESNGSVPSNQSATSKGVDADAAPFTLNMRQVYELSIAAFRARAFPDSGLEVMAERIVWMEERGLPALLAMTAEFTKLARGTVWNERFPKPVDGQLVFDCPFVAGTALSDKMDQLVTDDHSDIKGIMGPTNPFLFLPRIAEHAAKIGEPIEMFFKGGDPIGFVGQIVTDGDRILVSVPSIETLTFSKGLSFHRYGQPMPEEAWGARRTETTLSADWMLELAEFIARDQIDARPDQ